MTNLYYSCKWLCLLILLSSGLFVVAAEDTVQISFLENKGQWQEEIFYQGISLPLNIYFLKDGLSFAQSGEEEEDSTGEEFYPYLIWNLKYRDINPDVNIYAENGNPSAISYLYGNDSAKWVIHPNQYAAVHYQNIYNNIDLTYYQDGESLKYDYILHPGADVKSIQASFAGIENILITDIGELEIQTMWDTHIQKAPYSYQVIDGEIVEVESEYEIIDDTTFGFKITGDFVQSEDLIIDPLFEFYFSSYTKATGSSNNRNYCFSNAMDAAGNVYMTGMVDGTFPITPGAYMSAGAVDPEIFVAKFKSDGTTLLYSTYISGSSDEMGLGIAVDASGRAYITGHAMANWTGSNTYPSTASAYQTAMYPSGGYDVILTVLNAAGTGLVYSTYLGGSGDDEGYAVAVDASGYVYVTGYTYSWGTTFPTKGTSMASQQSNQGYRDAFVAKFDITQSGASSLIYSIHLGGGGDDYGRAIAVNSSGNAFVTGRFQAIMAPSFPTTAGAYKTTYAGGYDNMMSFVTKLSSTTPVTYNYSTYIGSGVGNAIAVDDQTGDIYLAGTTSTFTFPVTAGVIQSVHGQDALGNPNSDAYVLKLNAAGSALIYSTFLGGPSYDYGTGLTVNGIGEAYICGIAMDGFPTSTGALQENHATGGGDSDFFVVHLNSTASDYACGGSTYVGGNDNDYGTPMYDYASPKMSLRDYDGITDTICVSGTSHSTNFPTTAGVYGPSKVNGIADQPVFFKLVCDAMLLPSQLISFTGENMEGGNLIKWETASELNNDYFTLERSSDYLNFESITTITGAGTTASANQYQFFDDITAGNIHYYRLVMTDFSGTETFSPIIAISNANQNEVLIFPNPVHEILNVFVSDAEFNLSIISASGTEIYSATGLEDFHLIDTSNFPEGIYFIRVFTANSDKYLIKFVKD